MTLLPLERSSPADATVEALRDEILGGAYLPGTAIPDEEVQARLGVPRDHARTALARLEREGLLVHSLHRGLEVVRISVDDVRDLYATRRTLELAGLEAMVRRRPADDVCVWLQAADPEHDRGGQGRRRAGRGRGRRRVPPGDRRVDVIAAPAHGRGSRAARAADRAGGRRPGRRPISTNSPPTTSACSTRWSTPRPRRRGPRCSITCGAASRARSR